MYILILIDILNSKTYLEILYSKDTEMHFQGHRTAMEDVKREGEEQRRMNTQRGGRTDFIF